MIYTLAFICAAFLSGVFFTLMTDYLAAYVFLIVIELFLAASGIAMLFTKRKAVGILLILCMLAFALGCVHTAVYHNLHAGYVDAFYGKEVSVKGKLTEKTSGVIVKAEEINGSYVNLNIKFYASNYEKIECNVGDSVVVSGKLYRYADSAFYGDFNSRKYNLAKQVYGYIYSPEITVTKSSPAFFYKVRCKISDNINRRFYDDKGAFLKALLIGDKSEFTDDLKENLQKSSLSHVAAISGMHLSIIISFIGIYAAYIKKHKLLYILIMLVVMVFFTCLVGFQPSVLRAVIMSFYCMISVFKRKRYDAFTALMFSAAVLLIINPYFVLSISFQLSYAATLALIIAAYKGAGKVFYATLSLLLVTFPMCMFYFNYASLSVFFTNLIASPIITALLPLGYLMQIMPFLHNIINILLELFILITETFSSISIFGITGAVPAVSEIFAMYLCIGAFFALTLFGKRRIAAVLISVSLLLVAVNTLYPLIPDNSVTLFNNGNNTLHIKTQSGKNIICTSYFPNAVEYTVSYGIKKIDAVILTKFPSADDFDGADISKVYVPKVLDERIKGNFSVRYYDMEEITIDGVTITPVSYAPYMIKADDKKAVLLIDNGETTILFEPYRDDEMNSKYLSGIKADKAVLSGNCCLHFETVAGSGLQPQENMIYYNTAKCGSVMFYGNKTRTLR